MIGVSSETKTIRTERLSRRCGDTLALDALEPSEVYGYLGPSGAGQTTTIRLLLGLHPSGAGRAELFRRRDDRLRT